MNEPESILIFATISAALIGVVAFSLFRIISSRKKVSAESREHHQNESQSETHKGDNENGEQYQHWREESSQSSSQTCDSQSEELKYERILGLKGKVAASDVKKAYRELLSKYHPDKVNHLGDEFIHIADQKTREIIAAYEYYCKKYNIA